MESICQDTQATRLQEQLTELRDREAIRDCLYRYCRGIDRADEDALRSSYWPDGRDCHGAFNGNATAFIDQALPKLKAGGRRVHQIANILIELQGDVAAVESSFVALQTTASAASRETFLCGRYVDRFEKRNGEWRVAERVVVYDWIEERTRPELAQDDGALFGARKPNGAAAPGDPIYALLNAVREKR